MKSQPFFQGVMTAFAMIRRVYRWNAREYPSYYQQPNEQKETTLEHSASSVLIAHYLLCLERDHGTHYSDLNHQRILLGALLHDFGEGAAGDVTFQAKQDPILKAQLKIYEDRWSTEVLSSAPACMQSDMMSAHALEGESSLEGRFFAAIECLSYIIFARAQLEQEERYEFASALKRQHPRILAFAEEFGGVCTAYKEHRELLEKVAPLP
jgi:5'-deoxynucleotidase YfbR-like HD superfamily hydrolase